MLKYSYNICSINLMQHLGSQAWNSFWWRHNGPVTSQLNDPIKWSNYPLHLIGIYVHINTRNKGSLTQRCTSTNVPLCLIFFIYLYGLSINGWHELFYITNNHNEVTITTSAIKRHFLIWKTTVRQSTKRRCSCVLTLKYTFICVYWWTRQKDPQHVDCGRSIPVTHGG